MKIANVLESGIAGAATLTLLRETLDKVDPKGPAASFFKEKRDHQKTAKIYTKKRCGSNQIIC